MSAKFAKPHNRTLLLTSIISFSRVVRKIVSLCVASSSLWVIEVQREFGCTFPLARLYLFLQRPTATRNEKVSIALETLMNNSRFDMPHLARRSSKFLRSPIGYKFSSIVTGASHPRRVLVSIYSRRCSIKLSWNTVGGAKTEGLYPGIALLSQKSNREDHSQMHSAINICGLLSRAVIYMLRVHVKLSLRK